MTPIIEWIEENVKKYIHYFEYERFSQIVKIGNGRFGIVYKANLVNTGLVALKVIVNEDSEQKLDVNDEFVKELNLLLKVNYHPNINRIIGITKGLRLMDSEYYALVLEYADGGNLRAYLEKKFTTLEWNDKIQMALDISNGLRFLHSEGIIHRDLHSKNILVNNRKLIIADFGLSKNLSEVTTNSMGNKNGMLEYIEPQRFKDDKYKKDKKSDIYSLGVLLWEISSGIPPFLGRSQNELAFHISYNNLREGPIEGTPPEYLNLYQECWDGEPKSRPDIEIVYEILSKLKQSLQPIVHNEANVRSIDKDNLNSDNDDLNISSGNQNSNLINENGDPKSRQDAFDPPHYGNSNDVKKLEEGRKEKIRNFLIVGCALSGKTTLSNVLCDTDTDDEFIRENEYTINEIKNLQKKNFEWNGTKYNVIEIRVESIMKKVFYDEIIDLMPEGISQVLFTVNESFTAAEEIKFELYKEIIIETGILEYVTIVRNKFSNFKNKDECERDKKYIFEENKIIAEIIKSCNGIIHVDNPPINIYDYDNRIIVNRYIRKKSRIILLNYLEEICRGKYHKLEKWDDLHSSIVSCAKLDNFAEVETNKTLNIPRNLFNNFFSKSKLKNQDWFNKKYSGKENINIAESNKLKLGGFLKIKDFEKVDIISLKNFELIKLEISGCSKLTQINLLELSKLKNLTVIKCSNLTTLNCSLTVLTSLDISGCDTLKNIDLSKLPKLLNLSVTECQKLTRLDCSKTELTDLKIINCTQINKIITTTENSAEKSIKTKSLYVKGYSNLTTLDCSETDFTSLEISDCSRVDLSKLSKITSLTVIDSPNLTKFDCSSKELISLKISNCSKLNKIDLSKLSKLENLSVINCSNIIKFDCSSEELTSLKISGCSKLGEINPKNLPNLESLSVVECSNLIKLDCSETELTNLEIINCTRINKIIALSHTTKNSAEKFTAEKFTAEKFTTTESLYVKGYSNLTTLDCSETDFTSSKIGDCSQIDLSKFSEITSLTVIDCLKLKEFDCSSEKLTNLRISGCYTLKEVDLPKLPNLTSLSVIDCLKLEKLNCSSIKTLTKLEVSDLIELDCSNTSIEELSINLCPNIKKLICSNNNKLINLDVSNCFKLEFLDCSLSKLTSLDLRNCPESIEIIKSPDLIITRTKEKIKNILIIGCTGSGKTTLANVLTGTEYFKESEYGVSKTERFHKKVFEWKGTKYCVIDTIGVGNTKLPIKKVTNRIAEGVYSIPEGICQVLLVIGENFTDEVNTLGLFGSDIFEYTTIVRTKFSNFK
ncbi:hypothetical protein RclHR1_32050001, partial [Rhizophagus clarus]